ncbi:TPA: 30S ribosomal protein S1 [Candidatus Uhrbacteria bacterium]|nr:30S ribosomal protein S1 [Candidatus Uhrbacteria bacterium]
MHGIRAPVGIFFMANISDASGASAFAALLEDPSALRVPSLGDVIKGAIVSASRREVRLDIGGLTIGVVRGRELFAESDDYRNLKPGDAIEATVVDLENENGELELSFRYTGQKKAWEELRGQYAKNEIVEAKVLDANKGGLIVKVGHINGFLPVSQLSPDHYPRVSGGDKQKILDRLKTYVGTAFEVRVLDVNENDEKLIVSEKTVWEERQRSEISQYKVGGIVKGAVTALADFGAFVKFSASGSDASSLEGLVHISEIAWQRIDHPRDVLKVGDVVEAEIIGIEGSKIFLSMKKLILDPWTEVGRKYQVGDIVAGKILKVNPFGFFVELDQEIHGLAHVSELSTKPVEDLSLIGKEGETKEFKIVSIEPKEHRLGLSLKALKDKDVPKAEEAVEKKTETTAEPEENRV